MRKLINDGWSFAKLQAGSEYEDAEKADFIPVDLPHDWLIGNGENLYETADAWYRRTLEAPEGNDPVVMLRFDGVYMDCDVLLNGKVIGSHPYGYTAFDVPLNGLLFPGENELTVHIRHQSPNSRWYSGSGIYRDVFLITLPRDHMVPDGLYLTAQQQGDRWDLAVSAETEGREQPFRCVLYNQEGSVAAEAEGECSGQTARALLRITGGREWSPEDPYLYRLRIQYGEQTEERKIGLRSVSVSPDDGLRLNGRKMKLKGVCLHHDLGALGAAFHEKAARRQLALMKDMGANAVRTSHNPPASRFLDLCDEMGLLVVDEAFDMWERPKTQYDYARFFDEWYRKDVASWIRRDRCHPCVVMWSVGNEIYDMHADERGAEITRRLTEEVRTHDPLRHALTTFGCNYMPWSGGQKCAEYVDAVGYNYGERLYDAHHQKNPAWVIYGSETGSVLSSRGIYHFPMEQSIMSDTDRQCSALGNSNTSWGAESLKQILSDDLRNPFSLGQFIWSGIDYIGEPTPYHTRSCYFGQADTACYPKDSFYLFQSFWTEKKMIHIGVIWDWNAGQMIDVPVMTNCPETELFLNGKSLGRKKSDPMVPDQAVPVWKIPFEPGELLAKGYDHQGNPVCEDRKATPGETARFRLSCEGGFLLSDGWDITFVTIAAEDSRQRPVENARDRVRIRVEGGGRLLGTDNGDSTDPDSYQSPCRRLFSGKLLLIIGSNGKDGDVRVFAESNNGITAELVIPVRRAERVPGVSCVRQAANGVMPGGIPARRVDIRAEDETRLTPEHPECAFRYEVLPAGAAYSRILWQVTNAAGIESPYVSLREESDKVTVRAAGDGSYYLRALCMEGENCAFISQMEFSAEGFGNPALDPYGYISAGLYDLHEGEIGTGNEKGIAFARDGESTIGFSRVDFGKTGSDTVTADLFALNGDMYEMELLTADPNGKEHRVACLRYQKPSIWNVYQPETWKLPERLKGLQTLLFRMKEKVHMRGFSFEKQSGAYLTHPAGTADSIYGDCFRKEGDAVNGIGNNVTLTWTDMDFQGEEEAILEIDGSTPLNINTIHVRIRNGQGGEMTTAADFRGPGRDKQRFTVAVPGGNCTVSFVFLPGSSFDFNAFRFSKAENWTETAE